MVVLKRKWRHWCGSYTGGAVREGGNKKGE